MKRSVSKFSKKREKLLMSLTRGKLLTVQAKSLKLIMWVWEVVHRIINPRCQAEAQEVEDLAWELHQVQLLIQVLHQKRSPNGNYRVWHSDKLWDL